MRTAASISDGPPAPSTSRAAVRRTNRGGGPAPGTAGSSVAGAVIRILRFVAARCARCSGSTVARLANHVKAPAGRATTRLTGDPLPGPVEMTGGDARDPRRGLDMVGPVKGGPIHGGHATALDVAVAGQSGDGIQA